MLQLRSRVFFRYLLDEQNRLAPLIIQLFENKELLMNKQDFSLFTQAYLQELSAWIVCDELPVLEPLETENSIRLYLDTTNDHEHITLKLEYVYAETIIVGFADHDRPLSTSALLLRDYLKKLILPSKENENIGILKPEYQELEMLQDIIKQASEHSKVFISESLKNMTKPKQLQMQVGISVEHSLLQLTIDSDQIDIEELFTILRAYRQKKKFYKLKNGEMLALESTALQELDNMHEQLQFSEKELKNGKINIPSFRLFQTEQLSQSQEHIRYIHDTKSQQIKENFSKVHSQSFPLLCTI